MLHGGSGLTIMASTGTVPPPERQMSAAGDLRCSDDLQHLAVEQRREREGLQCCRITEPDGDAEFVDPRREPVAGAVNLDDLCARTAIQLPLRLPHGPARSARKLGDHARAVLKGSLSLHLKAGQVYCQPDRERLVRVQHQVGMS